MSGSSFTETDPTMQICEAIIVEKDQEIERLRQEIEKLRMENFNKNQLELTQKVAKLEEDLAASRADNLELKEQITALHLNISKNDKLSDKVEELVTNQSRIQKELSQKEEELAESENKHFELINRLISLDVKQLNEKDILSRLNLFSCAQNAVRTEAKVTKLSGIQQNTSVLILGYSGRLNTIYLLDSKAQSWKHMSIILPVTMRHFGAVVLNEEIYIFGGYGNYIYYHYCYKLKSDGSWIKLASLNEQRSTISSSSLVYKGDIWVIGGFSKEALKSVEKYDISQNKWTFMPELIIGRSNAAAAVFKDRIFVTGGYNKTKLKSVEMFDPKLQQWIFFCDLPIEVYDHTMLISNSTLSIFGCSTGSDILNSINSVWEMDIQDPEKKWTEKQGFKHQRFSFGIGKLSNGIIVFGDETSEIFDGNKWINGPKLPQDLPAFAYTSIPRSLEERFLKRFS